MHCGVNGCKQFTITYLDFGYILINEVCVLHEVYISSLCYIVHSDILIY